MRCASIVVSLRCDGPSGHTHGVHRQPVASCAGSRPRWGDYPPPLGRGRPYYGQKHALEGAAQGKCRDVLNDVAKIFIELDTSASRPATSHGVQFGISRSRSCRHNLRPAHKAKSRRGRPAESRVGSTPNLHMAHLLLSWRYLCQTQSQELTTAAIICRQLSSLVALPAIGRALAAVWTPWEI